MFGALNPISGPLRTRNQTRENIMQLLDYAVDPKTGTNQNGVWIAKRSLKYALQRQRHDKAYQILKSRLMIIAQKTTCDLMDIIFTIDNIRCASLHTGLI